MKRSIGIAVAAVWLALSAAASGQSLPTLSKQWAAEWSGKKLDAVMALYTPDAEFLPTVGRGWLGAATLRKNFAGLLAAYNPHIVLQPRRLFQSGDLAVESGDYAETISPVKPGKAIDSKGSYVFVFRRQSGGDWKFAEQTFTSFDPPPHL
ncbi:MAG TPA: nuclear transport factor 2 family protein [Rhizomicrobium sp.]|nr:nuclear transport factor 2 family protein [Rhizomicrobium sp.]